MQTLNSDTTTETISILLVYIISMVPFEGIRTSANLTHAYSVLPTAEILFLFHSVGQRRANKNEIASLSSPRCGNCSNHKFI